VAAVLRTKLRSHLDRAVRRPGAGRTFPVNTGFELPAVLAPR
jgi:hypothetical protein